VCAYASHQVPQLVATFRLDPARVRFLPLGVDPDFFPPIATADGAPYVLSVGTNEGKDFPTLLDALPPDAECLIVTDEQNEAAARRHGLPAGVTVRTHVPITELRDLYRRARHVVIPLRESDASSGQTVLLENLVSGRPVIVSRVSGVADYLAETGAVPVAPGDPAALRELLATPPRMPAAETTEYVRARFSSAAFARNLLALISG
jgi:glycosyltransferase involved in cell wall biosynthesis